MAAAVIARAQPQTQHGRRGRGRSLRISLRFLAAPHTTTANICPDDAPPLPRLLLRSEQLHAELLWLKHRARHMNATTVFLWQRDIIAGWNRRMAERKLKSIQRYALPSYQPHAGGGGAAGAD